MIDIEHWRIWELFPECSAAAGQLLQDSPPYWGTFASFCNLPNVKLFHRLLCYTFTFCPPFGFPTVSQWSFCLEIDKWVLSQTTIKSWLLVDLPWARSSWQCCWSLVSALSSPCLKAINLGVGQWGLPFLSMATGNGPGNFYLDISDTM